MILFDTDVCIEILRGNKDIISKRNNYEGRVAISFMTVAELFYGAFNSQQIEHNCSLVEEFLLTVIILESDYDIMKRFGILKSQLKAKNNLLPDADIIIAATTIEKCECLISGNISHFQRFEELNIENWIK